MQNFSPLPLLGLMMSHGSDGTIGGWGPWLEFGACYRRSDGYCKRTRHRYCTDNSCDKTQQSQDRNCGLNCTAQVGPGEKQGKHHKSE